MKRITLIFCLLTFAVFSTFSQNKMRLDENNGFKSYKLGSPKESFKNLGLLNVSGGKYLVVNNLETKVFDFKVNSVYLTFDKQDKLVTISIKIMKDENNGKIGFLSPYFEMLYGPKTFAKPVGNAGDGVEIWEGDKVVLMVLYEFKGTTGDWNTSVHVTSRADFFKDFYNGF